MAEDTVVKATGGIYLENGGTASNTTMNDDGELFISSGGVHKGTLQIEEDAYVFVHDGGKIDFTLSDRTTEDDYLLNDLSLVLGTPSYTITISENQAYGTYKLAQGSSAFTETISIGTASTTYGSITVNGEDFVYDGITYSLDQIDGNLTIYIDDITPPEKPIVVADITEMTNKDITITATYTDDSAVKQYKINDGEWQIIPKQSQLRKIQRFTSAQQTKPVMFPKSPNMWSITSTKSPRISRQ
jgi:autotransporter passenger strand-loop-strand repeat protein